MFTGLVEAIGRVAHVAPTAGGLALGIETPLAAALAPGESVAVNGVCLTVTSIERDLWHADIGPETARLTTLASLAPGRLVNLERSLRADGRLGGHFVLGHVDATGEVRAVRLDGEAHWVTIAFPLELAALFIAKGSVAVDGISLTVAALRRTEFDVMIVPFTWQHTTMGARREGDRVNLECDVLGKYVARAMELTGDGTSGRGDSASGIT